MAHPSLGDPYFEQSVVAVTYAEREGGPIGVIINKPGTKRLKDLAPNQPGLENHTDLIHFGGPVMMDRLCFIFRATSSRDRSLRFFEDIYFSADFAILDDLANQTKLSNLRFFAGYSSWARGQLEYEIASGAWYVLAMDKDLLFATQVRSMWRDLLLRARAVQALAVRGM